VALAASLAVWAGEWSICHKAAARVAALTA